MIPYSKVGAIITGLSTAINARIIRSDQPGKAPAYPYGTWKLLSNREESAHQNIKTYTSGVGVTLKTYSANKSPVSFNFIDANREDRILELAQDSIDWFKSIEGRELAHTNEIVVQIIHPNVEDRTSYLDTEFENKYGFDVRFDYMGRTDEEVGSIDSLEIENERDGVDQPSITYP